MDMKNTEATRTTCSTCYAFVTADVMATSHQHSGHAGRKSTREAACRHCGHAAIRHDDMGCDGCANRDRECVGYDPR